MISFTGQAEASIWRRTVTDARPSASAKAVRVRGLLCDSNGLAERGIGHSLTGQGPVMQHRQDHGCCLGQGQPPELRTATSQVRISAAMSDTQPTRTTSGRPDNRRRSCSLRPQTSTGDGPLTANSASTAAMRSPTAHDPDMTSANRPAAGAAAAGLR